MNIFEEKPNNNAKIAFVVWTPFDFYVYKNVIKYLPEDEIVICNSWFKTLERGGTYIPEVIELAKKNNVPWRIIYSFRLGNSLESKKIEKFFAKYELAVGLRLWPPLASSLFGNWFFKKKSVLMNYGAGKDLITFGPWVARFDIALSNGPREHKYFNLLSKSFLIGVPKYDDWFNGTIDTDNLLEIKKNLDPARKTILYLPTHSSFSSLYKFGDSVSKLSDSYNVIIKLHYLNYITESGIVEKLKQNKKILIYDQQHDILPLLSVSDTVISDSSSASLEAILVDKPLIILDIEKNENDLTADNENNGLWYSSGQIYSKSIEQQIKKPEMAVGEVVSDPKNIEQAVKISFEPNSKHQENRGKLRKELFSFNDGKCGARAANIIRKYLSDEIKPETPLLGMAIRTYFSSKAKEYQEKWWKKEAEIQKLKEIIGNLNREKFNLGNLKSLFKRHAK